MSEDLILHTFVLDFQRVFVIGLKLCGFAIYKKSEIYKHNKQLKEMESSILKFQASWISALRQHQILANFMFLS